MSDGVHRDDLAPYLLGALAEPDAAALERHLEGCPRCRAALDELRPAVTALPDAVPQLDPPPGLKASLMAVVEREAQAAEPAGPAADEPARARPRATEPLARRRLGRLWPRPRLAFAAAALVAVGIAVGYALGSSGDDDARVVAAQVDRARIPSGTASLRVEDGEAILTVRDFPRTGRGAVYQVWLQRDGRITAAGLFGVGPGGEGAAAVGPRLTDRDTVMVTREPEGGSPAPTEQPLLSVRV